MCCSIQLATMLAVVGRLLEVPTGKAGDACVAYESSYHIEKGCECLVFESFGGSRGTFTSPNFPSPYPPRTPCILYTFIGDEGEIVQISFQLFNLPHILQIYGRCSDYVRLYLDLDRPELSSDTRPSFELCGNLSSVNKFYFSLQRSLILEFHSDGHSTSLFSGFKASYSFIGKSKFDAHHGARRRWPTTDCTYDIRSIEEINKTGDFFSPGYPLQTTSPSCKYFFHPGIGEHVILNFTSIQFDGGSPLRCTGKPRAAIITVWSGFEGASSPVIERFCGSLKATEEAVVVSNDGNILVEFVADRGVQFQGFAASFRFELQKEIIRHVTSSQSSFSSTVKSLDHVVQKLPGAAQNSENALIGSLQSTESYTDECNISILSSISGQGVITSPNYPRPYHDNQTCRFFLRGHSKQQVQLTFLDFDINHNHTGPVQIPHIIDCGDSDSLTVYSANPSFTEFDSLGEYCGSSEKPPDLMSITGCLFISMKATVTADPHDSRGFKARYTFTRDFGIKSGEQVDSECSFAYRSSKSQNGTFHTPNFPGFYPRNITCHYKFYGTTRERVEITFTYLDVDGFYPGCGAETLSDLIELSNFNAPLNDRKLLPLCGTNREPGTNHPVKMHRFLSDGNFFRVTFKSNQVYDSSGFKASYKFLIHETDDRTKRRFSLKSGTTTTVSAHVRNVCFAFTSLKAFLAFGSDGPIEIFISILILNV